MARSGNDPKAGKPYGSAFVSHVRTLVDESDQSGAPQIMAMPLGWSALIVSLLHFLQRLATHSTTSCRCVKRSLRRTPAARPICDLALPLRKSIH